jgi:hypothetical protein
MDTEQFLILAEEIAKQHPEDQTAVRFLELCNEEYINERDCISLAGEIMLRHVV